MPSRYQDTDAFEAAIVLGQIGDSKIEEFGQIEGPEGQIIIAPGISGVCVTEERHAKRLKTEHLREETIKKCTVIVPRLDLPTSVRVWCIFHCTYNCPCDKYKDPLDFGPDLSASRNVAKRTIGGHFKTSKLVTPAAKIVPQMAKRTGKLPSKPTQPAKPVMSRSNSVGSSGGASTPATPKSAPSKGFKFSTDQHCARTSGMIIRQKNKTQMPHKIVVAKKSEERRSNDSLSLPGITSLHKQESLPHQQQQQQKQFVKREPIIIRNPLDPLDLSVKPKGEVQYVRWNVLRAKFESREIIIWCFFRLARPALFITKSHELPYVRQAFDVRHFRDHQPIELPPMVESLVTEEGKKSSSLEFDDTNKYAILSSSGLAWEVNGVLQRKATSQKPPPEASATITATGQSQSLPTKIPSSVPVQSGIARPSPLPPVQKKADPAPIKAQHPLAKDPEPANSEATQTCVVSLESTVSKLPVGKNLVTMTKDGQPIMQIKLPVTSGQQHWSTIKVDGKEGSVQCPESSLALKVAVLKQAATLAMKEQTTVRIPIPVTGESESFGVYAVPGLSTHVFVGPFTARIRIPIKSSGQAELICLDDDDVVEEPPAPPQLDDDEIQEIFPAVPQQQQHHDGFVKYGDLPTEPLPEPPAAKQKVEKTQKINRQKAIMGQVPLVVSRNQNEENDIEIVDLDAHNDSAEKAEVVKTPKPQYVNIPPSDYGRTIFRKDKNKIFEDEASMIWVKIPDFGDLRVHFTQTRVTFPHPSFSGHEVVCSNVDKVRLWMKEFVESKSATKSRETQNPKTSNGNLAESASLADSGMQSRPKQHVARIFQNGGQKSATIVINRKKIRDGQKLFFKLNEVKFWKHFRSLKQIVELT